MMVPQKCLQEGSMSLEIFDRRLLVIFMLCLSFHWGMNFHGPLHKAGKCDPAEGLVEWMWRMQRNGHVALSAKID